MAMKLYSFFLHPGFVRMSFVPIWKRGSVAVSRAPRIMGGLKMAIFFVGKSRRILCSNSSLDSPYHVTGASAWFSVRAD